MTRRKKRKSNTSENTPRASQRRRGVPKLCGSDVELGNFVLGLDDPLGTGAAASRALLRQIEGVRAETQTWAYSSGGSWGQGGITVGGGGYSFDNRDWGRKYLPGNGGCVYIDLDHIELCTPEVISAWDHVAASHAMLRIVRRAQTLANREMPEGQSIQVLVNNSDGLSHSYGSHLNFLITRETWDNLFGRKLHQLLFLAAYQVSSIVFTGQGKVGSENGQPAAPYQLSQRADFVETLMGSQTTHWRPIVNSRDEALCGANSERKSEAEQDPGLARLHCIFFDNTLCHVASLLKVGVTQIILSMIEADVTNLDLLLDDPVRAVVHWSHGSDLQARSRLTSGEDVTAVELQLRFCEEAKKFAQTGGLDMVPGAEEILALWEDTLLKLQARDLASLTGRLDWVLKLHVIEQSLKQRGDLDWDSPELKYLDLIYGSVDPSEGLYWAYEDSGVVERVVSDAEIERFVHEPPEDTRAWTRAMLLRVLDADRVDDIDWDEIKVLIDPDFRGAGVLEVKLDDPLGFTRSDTEELFQGDRPLAEILRGLLEESRQEAPVTLTASRGSHFQQ
jgi:proteasome accessory factor A